MLDINIKRLFYVPGHVPVSPNLQSMGTWIEFISYCCVKIVYILIMLKKNKILEVKWYVQIALNCSLKTREPDHVTLLYKCEGPASRKEEP